MVEETTQQKATMFTPDQENYIEWLTLPDALRNPRTKTEYAERLKINRSTLWRWEQLSGFDDERKNKLRSWLKESTPQIVETLKNKAISGDIQAIKIFLEWVEGLENKLRVSASEPVIVKFVRENGNNKTCDVDKPV
jgi:hypothetical protein